MQAQPRTTVITGGGGGAAAGAKLGSALRVCKVPAAAPKKPAEDPMAVAEAVLSRMEAAAAASESGPWEEEPADDEAALEPPQERAAARKGKSTPERSSASVLQAYYDELERQQSARSYDVRAPIRMATPATLTEATLIEGAASGLVRG